MSWAIGFVTLERPDAAQRFVRSARRVFPDVPVYVAEQSRTLGPMAEFYAAERVTVIRMPFDAGLSTSRNALVDAMDVDYFALCDDDFVLGPATAFTTAIRVLEQDAELGVVGGMLHDYDRSTESIRNWEMFFDHDARNQRFTATPIYNYLPVARQVAGEIVYLCDAVLNFAVFRKAMFSTGIRWEESIKVNGEHEDFYLNLKKHSSYRVAYLPTMAALHWQVQRHANYSKLRCRDDGRREFLRKWGLLSHLEIGAGSRPLDGTPVHSWFAGSNAEAGRIAHSSAQPAGAALDVPGGISRGQLYTDEQHEGTRLAPPVARPGNCPEAVAPNKRRSRPIPAGRLLFCYQPAVEPEGCLLLWHRATHQPDDAAGERDGAGVILRWFSSQGDVLVWESEAHAIQYTEDRYWQPLVVNLPLWPRSADSLRFEILSACEKRTPLATGFVFADGRFAQQPHPAELPGVLAWCPPGAQSAHVGCEQRTLAELLASAPRVEIDVVQIAGLPWVTMDVSRFEFSGIISGRAAEPGLLLATGLRHVKSASAPLAIPLALLVKPENVLFAGEADLAEQRLFIIVPRLVDVMQTGESTVAMDSPCNDTDPGFSGRPARPRDAPLDLCE